ncbi:hypothetical protein [Halodesulfovibrio marinisediminis]|uniref:Uncharacterized protein n=1 Tax=Halodesulfovibrio marinisediminis DSM 17456 TaxID=1121457 RepID=A0A1N6DG51_9BACT|nr:hypothetical protein [Halodesulfovibrio marinisediminis]SIN69634.1 hypothetical protein SAMN02745161_0102 [Halodesulfovibrio marinisediminis DSM 17456]
MHTNLEAIYSILSKWLKNGQKFTADVKEYAETVLGVCTLSELESLVADSDNPDLEPFFEYIIFPDETLLHTLEPILTVPLSSDDIAELTSRLATKTPCITLHEATKTCSVPIPEWMWDDFIARLHLDDTTVTFLVQSLSKTPETIPLKTQSYLRTANIPDVPFLRNALVQFFMTTLPHDPLVNVMLSTWVDVLTSLPSNCEKNAATLEQHLEKRRRRLYKAIFDANEFTRKLQRFNMETLMMSGDLPPAINVEEARMQIRIIDRIAIALFQKNVGAIEELEDRSWGDYVDYRQHLMLLPAFEDI